MSIIKANIKLQKAYILTCLIEKYLRTELSGGSLHVILEDGNYFSDLDWIIKGAKERNDYMGELIATLLTEFNKEEQKQIIERYWEIEEQINKLCL